MDLGILMDRISLNTAENCTFHDSDYMKEGLLHCGVCHAPKQCRVNFLGNEEVRYCMCRCDEEIFQHEEELKRKSEYDNETECLRNLAFPLCYDFPPDLPQRDDMRKWTFENTNGSNPEIMEMARKYAENFDEAFMEGLGFLFYGNVGSGKSYVSACIANTLVGKHRSVLMTTFGQIRSEIQGTYEKKAVYERLNRIALLIIDDLATESSTDYSGEIVFSVINNRISAGLPLIVTTNLSQEEMSSPKDIRYRRLFSRINGCCTPVKFSGSDQRKNKARETARKMRQILSQGEKTK